MTDYAKWSKFDYDKSSIDIEEQSKVSDRDTLATKLHLKQTTMENTSVDEELISAESYESTAAVDVMRKIRGGRSKRKVGSSQNKLVTPVEDNIDAPPAPPIPTPLIPLIPDAKTRSLNAATRAKHLQSSITSRETGKSLAKSKQYTLALQTFQQGHLTLDSYESLLEVVSSTGVVEVKGNTNSKDLCCGPDAEKVKEMQLQLKPSPLQPDKNNLPITLRRDFNLNIGRCYLSLDHYSEASEALKQVLLVDGGNVSAWVARAECFRRMGLFTLADLHLVKAGEIDDVDVNAKVVMNLNLTDLKLQKDEKKEKKHEKDNIQTALDSNKSGQELLVVALNLHKQANVIFREQFFHTACIKYEQSIAYITASTQVLNINVAALPSIITEILTTNHLSAAACYLLRKRDFGKAEVHCTLALNVSGGSNITALVRRSEARVEIGDFVSAISDLKFCQKVINRLNVKMKKKGNRNAAELQANSLAMEEVNKRLERVKYLKSQLTGQVNPDLLR